VKRHLPPLFCPSTLLDPAFEQDLSSFENEQVLETTRLLCLEALLFFAEKGFRDGRMHDKPQATLCIHVCNRAIKARRVGEPPNLLADGMTRSRGELSNLALCVYY
jgi:hypothetical protein